MKKKFPTDIEIKSITEGFIRDKGIYDTLLISPNLPRIYSPDTLFLIIYAIYPQLSRITCYPVKSSVVWKIKIELLSSNTKIVTEIASLLKPFEIIHTTGLSLKNEMYMVENYISGNNKWQSAIELAERIGKLQKINHCTIEIVD